MSDTGGFIVRIKPCYIDASVFNVRIKYLVMSKTPAFLISELNLANSKTPASLMSELNFAISKMPAFSMSILYFIMSKTPAVLF